MGMAFTKSEKEKLDSLFSLLQIFGLTNSTHFLKEKITETLIIETSHEWLQQTLYETFKDNIFSITSRTSNGYSFQLHLQITPQLRSQLADQNFQENFTKHIKQDLITIYKTEETLKLNDKKKHSERLQRLENAIELTEYSDNLNNILLYYSGVLGPIDSKLGRRISVSDIATFSAIAAEQEMRSHCLALIEETLRPLMQHGLISYPEYSLPSKSFVMTTQNQSLVVVLKQYFKNKENQITPEITLANDRHTISFLENQLTLGFLTSFNEQQRSLNENEKRVLLLVKPALMIAVENLTTTASTSPTFSTTTHKAKLFKVVTNQAAEEAIGNAQSMTACLDAYTKFMALTNTPKRPRSDELSATINRLSQASSSSLLISLFPELSGEELEAAKQQLRGGPADDSLTARTKSRI